MIRIPCPFCGLRDHAEFTYEGDATADWPAVDDPDVDRWHQAVFLRGNPAGLHRELWWHKAGCRMWLSVLRDTLTHEIHEAAPAHPGVAEALEAERREG